MPKIHKKRLAKKDPSTTLQTWKDKKPSSKFGELVFAKLERSNWWPAVVIDGSLCGQEMKKENYEWVYWYRDGRVSFVAHHRICSFREYFRKLSGDGKSKKCAVGVEKALQDCAAQDGYQESDIDSLVHWAMKGFPPYDTSKVRDLSLSDEVRDDLEKVKRLLMSDKKPDIKAKLMTEEEKVDKMKWKTSIDVHSEEDRQEASGSSSSVGNKDLDNRRQESLKSIQTLCIACRKASKRVDKAHPLFHGGICDDCEDNLKRYMFALDEDGFMVVCSVCANTGELLICDKPGCRRVYCTTCIEDMISKEAVKEFKGKNPWVCLICKNYDKGLLIRREDWWENVTKLFEPSAKPSFTNISLKKDKGIRVLSLFDGISAGYHALVTLGIVVDCYYASEIDEKAINVSQYNFPDQISHIGDIELLTPEKIAELGPIDLIIGGSPCNDISGVNPARKGLYAPDGTGRLFFEYFRVLKTIQELRGSGENPVFWMYENVASMPLKYREIISRFLGCEPTLINAKDFSAQHRPRFFWSSIPGVSQLSEVETNDCPTLSTATSSTGMRVATVDKINTVTTNRNSLKTNNNHPMLMNGEMSSIWITELEEVFGFPRHYTDVANLSATQRLKLLGKSWSVQVVKNIFSPLRHIFAVRK